MTEATQATAVRRKVDPEILKLAKRRMELKPLAKELREIETKLKDLMGPVPSVVRGAGVEVMTVPRERSGGIDESKLSQSDRAFLDSLPRKVIRFLELVTREIES